MVTGEYLNNTSEQITSHPLDYFRSEYGSSGEYLNNTSKQITSHPLKYFRSEYGVNLTF